MNSKFLTFITFPRPRTAELKFAQVCILMALAIGAYASRGPSQPAPKLGIQVVPVTLKLASGPRKSDHVSWDSEDVIPIKYPPVPNDLQSGITEMLEGAVADSSRFRLFEKASGAQYRVEASITDFKWDIDSMAASLQGDFRRNSKDLTAIVKIDADVFDLVSGKVAQHLVVVGKASGSFVQLSLNTSASSNSFQACPIGQATRNALNILVTRLNRHSATLPWRSKVAAIQQPAGQKPQIYFSGGTLSAVSEGFHFTILHGTKTVGHCTVVQSQSTLSLADITDGDGIQVGNTVLFEPKK